MDIKEAWSGNASSRTCGSPYRRASIHLFKTRRLCCATSECPHRDISARPMNGLWLSVPRMCFCWEVAQSLLAGSPAPRSVKMQDLCTWCHVASRACPMLRRIDVPTARRRKGCGGMKLWLIGPIEIQSFRRFLSWSGSRLHGPQAWFSRLPSVERLQRDSTAGG